MKKIFSVILAAGLLAGCAADNAASSMQSEESTDIKGTVSTPETTSGTVDTGDGSVLIAWFSRVGNSDFDENVDAVTGASTNIEDGELKGNNAYVEEIVESKTGADEYFIQVEDLYPGNFNETVRQFVEEERDDYFHPLATSVENMDQYDTMILIYPTWDSTLPSPVRTFLKSYDFSGKKIYPVNSNDGFGRGDSISRIETYAAGAEVMDSFSIDDDDFAQLDAQLTQYLNEQGLSR